MAANAQPLPTGRFRRVPATWCSRCGEMRLLKGPMYSSRLKASYWVLCCSPRKADHGKSSHDDNIYYWQNGTTDSVLQPMSPDVLERMHSRASYPFPIPACCRQKMNPQRKDHLLEGGANCEILHCRCRRCKKDRFLVLPYGTEAVKEEWGQYCWEYGGKGYRTVPRRAEDGTALHWTPPGFESWPIERQIFGLFLLQNPDTTNRELGQLLDDSRLINPFGKDPWERSLTEPGSGATWLAKLRKSVRRPAPR